MSEACARDCTVTDVNGQTSLVFCRKEVNEEDISRALARERMKVNKDNEGSQWHAIVTTSITDRKNPQ